MPSPYSGLVTRTVPKVTGGVSQRSPVVRDLSESTELINVLPDPVNGNIRRPASQFNAAISGFNNAHYLHTFQFSETEKYALFIKSGGLTVVDLINKTEMDVVVATDAEDYLELGPYQTGPTAFQAMSIGNEVFILNRGMETAAAATESAEDTPAACVWVRLGDNGTNYTITLDGTDYTLTTSATNRTEIDTRNIANALKLLIPRGLCISRIKPGGFFANLDFMTVTETISGKSSFTQVYPLEAPPTVTLNDICTELKEVLFYGAGDTGNLPDYQGVHWLANWVIGGELVIEGIITSDNFTFTAATTNSSHGASLGNFTVTNLGILAATYNVTVKGSSLIITRQDGADFTISVGDGLGNQALECIKGNIQRFSDLPLNATEGFKVQVMGDLSSETDNFYAQYTEVGSVGDSGVWQESLKGDELTSLDPATMPHILAPDGSGGWTFGPAEWNPRVTGSLVTNPMPSFVGHSIDDMFFFKNRVGFVSGENRTMSQSGQYFNFFRKSVAQLLDDERIDVASNSGQVNKIKFSTFQDHELILWGDEGQISVTGNPLLTPKTVSEDLAGKFKTSPDVRPVPSGKFTYFLTERTGTTQVSEYYSVDAAKPRKEIHDITENVPTYLNGAPTLLDASDVNGMIFVGAESETI